MIYGIGCYIRLSHADESTNAELRESNSVQNQRALIRQYLSAHPEFSGWKLHEFVDDGYSGTNENRPEFQRMIHLIQIGQIHCIIVKDFSRFARNYIITGKYLEQEFPLLGVRFISISDGYDSASVPNSLEQMSVTLKSILHSYYSRDLSMKIYSCNTQRMKSGQFAGVPCYGYVMSSDKTHFVIDPEAAKVVRLVFDMALAGKTRPEIVRYLNDMQIPPPAVYHRMQGRVKGNIVTAYPLWDHVKVSKLLRQEAYTGKLIMRKHVQPVPCVRKYRKTAPEEQFVKENAHEPIVSKEEFDRVQELMPKRKGWDRKNQRMYLLKGLVRCGTCGKVMFLTDTPRPGGFQCKESLIEHSVCSSRIYPMDVLEQIVFQRIKDIRLPMIGQNEQFIRSRCAEDKYQPEPGQAVQELPQDYELAVADANRYHRYTELTREMVTSFVQGIYVFDRHIEIRWKYQWLTDEAALDPESEGG